MPHYVYSNYFTGSDGQLPKEKLSQLKQVLTSPFFNSVKEVYEHVYSTVDIDSNSSSELRATATAKVSVCFLCFRLKSVCVCIVCLHCPVKFCYVAK